jgi:hypothetical protein
MEDLKYNNQEIQSPMGGKMAIIDSANSSLQIPSSEFY